MSRIEIELPGEFRFKTQIPVRINDINYGGHLGNDSILTIMHEARLQFLKSINCTELNLFGASVIQADTAIVYKSEGFYGDILTCEVTPGDFSRAGFDLYYRLTNSENGKEIAIGKTGMVCFNYEKRKVISVPAEFVKMFSGK